MKYLLFCAALLGLPANAQASDGYWFRGNHEIKNAVFTVEVVTHKNRKSLLDAAKNAGIKHTEPHAFSTMQGEKCVLHIMDPHSRYLPEHIGHEVVHCIYGNWH